MRPSAYCQHPSQSVRRRSSARRLARALLLLLGLPLAAAAADGLVMPGFYDVQVPAPDQSSSARLDASRQGLLEVLVRQTGLTSIPRTEPVRDALAAPDLYYRQFGFVELSRQPLELALALQFDPNAVLRLVRQAHLPLWPARRPRLVAWVALEEGGRTLLGAGDAARPGPEAAGNGSASGEAVSLTPLQALGGALVDRARARGVPLTLPLLDLEDQVAVTPAAVWGRLSQVLTPASARYGAELVLVGRVEPLADGWLGRWTTWLDGTEVSVSFETGDTAEQGRLALDFVADELVQRYAVLGRDSGAVSLGVAGLRTAADYGALMAYLRRLEYVDDLQVQGLVGDRLELTLVTRAAPAQLRRLFADDGRLLDDDLALNRTRDLDLVWRRP